MKLLVSLCAALFSLVWLVFGQTLSHEFVNYDDGIYVYANPKITGGLTSASVAWAFTHSHARNWHPLTTLSHMLDWQLYRARAGGHHFTNVVLHSLAVVLLFLWLRQITGALWRSAFVAALFAIHPLRVESVAWIAERKDVLSGVFFFLTFLAYVRYTRAPSLARLALVIVAFGLGLISKSMLVTLPFLLLLLDFWPLRRFRLTRDILLEKVPLLALSAVSSAITFLIQKQGGAQAGSLPFAERFGDALVACCTYLRQMFWPADLAPFYPRTVHPAWEIIGAALLLAAITTLVLAQRKARPYFFTGWFWYLGMLVPVLGLVQVGAQSSADRYTYLPQIGLYLCLTWGAAELCSRRILAPLSGLIIAAFSVLAWQHASYWQNSETLWTHTLAVTSENDVAEINLGEVLEKRGETEAALAQYENALTIHSRSRVAGYDLLLAVIHTNIGSIERARGASDDAIVHFRAALDSQPDYVEASLNLGLTLIDKHEIAEAITVLRRAIELRPDSAEAFVALGDALRQSGQIEEASERYEQALRNTPDSIAALNNLTVIRATSRVPALRNGVEAVALAERALKISGANDPFFLQKLAAAYAENGDFVRAIDCAERALTLTENAGLAAELQRNISLYRNGTPLRY